MILTGILFQLLIQGVVRSESCFLRNGIFPYFGLNGAGSTDAAYESAALFLNRKGYRSSFMDLKPLFCMIILPKRCLDDSR